MIGPAGRLWVGQVPVFTRQHPCEARGLGVNRCPNQVEYVVSIGAPFTACRRCAWAFGVASYESHTLMLIDPIDEYRTFRPVFKPAPLRPAPRNTARWRRWLRS